MVVRLESNSYNQPPEQSPGWSIGNLGDLIDYFGGTNEQWAEQASGGGSARLAQVAKWEIGAANSDAEGNAKYTPGWTSQHWCADFVNWCIEQAGGRWTDSSMAKSFINGDGTGHVGILVDWQLVGGNQGDAVSAKAMPSDYTWNTIENVTQGNYTPQTWTPPEWAIIVTSRAGGGSDPDGTEGGIGWSSGGGGGDTGGSVA